MNTQVIVGKAGSGKSFELKRRMESGAKYLLTSTTGISAVNLGSGVTTVNSALGFYDLRSLRYEASRNNVRRKFVELACKHIKYLVIDEVSMLQAEALQLIYQQALAAQELLGDRARDLNHVRDGLGEALNEDDATGLLLVGDFCQLAPIGDRMPDGKAAPAQYAFESQCWVEFEQPDNITHLTKVWRQDDERFLKALNLVRAGRSVDAAIDLKQAGVKFTAEMDEDFDGITLFAINQQVDAFNARRLCQLPGQVITIPSKRWGKERSEWKNIPEKLEVKDGALVMVLANAPGTFEYVNGDLATFHVTKSASVLSSDVDDFDFLPCDSESNYTVETKRGYRGPIPFVIRRSISYNEPEEQTLKNVYEQTTWGKQLTQEDSSTKRWKAIYFEYVQAHTMRGTPYYDPKDEGVVIGEVEYMPLRVAYASTVHKVQGLTLDNVQVNISHFWFGNPSMVYVALSRARSINGLRIVGDVGRLSRRIKTDGRVKRWV